VSDPNLVAPPEKRTYPRLVKWAGYFTTACVVVLVLTQLISMFGPASLPDCDSSNVQDSLRDIFSKPPKATISAWDTFTPGAKTADSLACTANLTFVDKTRALLSYRVYIKDSHVMVAVDDVKAL
jgi:hypothetical protein